MSDDLFRFSIPITIRYRDIDAQGHVNHAVYFSFMEQARVEYVRQLGLWTSGRWDDLGFIIVEACCTYERPIYYGDPVVVWLRVSRLGNKSLHMAYRIEAAGALAAQARTVSVCYDYHVGATRPIPESWRATITEYEPALRRLSR